MDPYTLAILFGAALASSAAGVYTNTQNIKYAQGANDVSIALANTAHQREVRDLQAAGLNPILSATGSGAAVPQLKVPGLENPLGDLNSSASGIAAAVNGLKKAEIATAEAEATSAEHERDILNLEKGIAEASYGTEVYEGGNSFIEQAARNEALSGVRTSDCGVDWSVPEAKKAYLDLVQQFRNEIEQGRYMNSMERQVFKDTLDAATSSAGAVSRFMPRTIRRLKGR